MAFILQGRVLSVFMILLALLIGIYTLGLFLIGVMSQLHTEMLFWYSFIYWGVMVIVYTRYLSLSFRIPALNALGVVTIILLAISILVNLVGALGPELAFDSLWYHLTIPKLYLEYERIRFFSGGLLYYSVMPKFTELLYAAAFTFTDSSVLAKLIHFSFGLLGLFALYLLSRHFLSVSFSLLVTAVMASNLVFAWEMITAYTDLTWMYFEVMAFFTFVLFYLKKQGYYVLLSGVFVGFSVMTKPVALISLFIYLFLIIFMYRRNVKEIVQKYLFLLIPAVMIPLPWFVFAFINTSNPLYPFFSGYLSDIESGFFSPEIVNPMMMIRKIGSLFLFASDPISPVYIILMPLILFVFKSLNKAERMVFLYCLCSLIVWYLLPQSGGARFILPYLPIFSLSIGIIISKLQSRQRLYNLSVIIVILTLSITIVYRGAANAKYLPVIIGIQSERAFLTNHLNFDFGDFSDTDGYFEKNITDTQRVLLIGFHNLYYVHFPYVHQSYRDGEFFTHVATQNADLPDIFAGWPLIYENSQTRVRLYERPPVYE